MFTNKTQSGINLITYYAATIYQQYIGLGGTTARVLAAANGTEYFIASWVVSPNLHTNIRFH